MLVNTKLNCYWLCIFLKMKYLYYLGLPIQHRLAGQAYIFCCWTFFIYHHTKLGVGRSPTPRTVGAMGTKSEKFLISSVPAPHAEYTTTNLIPPVGAVAAVKDST